MHGRACAFCPRCVPLCSVTRRPSNISSLGKRAKIKWQQTSSPRAPFYSQVPKTLVNILSNCDSVSVLIWASAAGWMISLVLVCFQGILTLPEAMETWMEGMKVSIDTHKPEPCPLASCSLPGGFLLYCVYLVEARESAACRRGGTVKSARPPRAVCLRTFVLRATVCTFSVYSLHGCCLTLASTKPGNNGRATKV